MAGTSSAEAASAPTSPQAFSRHQIQRNTSTTPTPAPSSRLATQAARIDASWVITDGEREQQQVRAARDAHQYARLGRPAAARRDEPRVDVVGPVRRAQLRWVSSVEASAASIAVSSNPFTSGGSNSTMPST